MYTTKKYDKLTITGHARFAWNTGRDEDDFRTSQAFSKR